jgi:hypothetical protein
MSATAEKPLVDYLDHLPQGWFALDVLPVREDKNCQVWAALLVDVEPDNLKRCDVDFQRCFTWIRTNIDLDFGRHIRAGTAFQASTEANRKPGMRSGT